MDYQTILYETEGRIATITLNRPEKLNAIRPPMPEELEAAVARANADSDVRVIVLRGAGRAFCAGFDFSEGLEHFRDAVSSSPHSSGLRFSAELAKRLEGKVDPSVFDKRK